MRTINQALLAAAALATAEGDALPIPAHYDIAPASGTSTVFTLSLNELARPVYADPATDGVAAIAVDGDEVTVGVRTREGLSYRLLSATALSTNAVWTPTGDAKAGTGAAVRLSCPLTNDWSFYKVRAND